MPGVQGESFASARDGGKNVVEALEAPGGECERHVVGVHGPAEENLSRTPRAVTFGKFGGGNRFGAMGRVVGRERPKHVIDGCKEGTAGSSEGRGGALCGGEEVINEDVHTGQRATKIRQ